MKNRLLVITLVLISVFSTAQVKKKKPLKKTPKTYTKKTSSVKKSTAKIQNENYSEESYTEQKPNERTGLWSYTKKEENSSIFESTRTYKIEAFLDGKYYSSGTLYVDYVEDMDEDGNEFNSYIVEFCGHEKSNSFYTDSMVDDLVKKCLQSKYDAQNFNF